MFKSLRRIHIVGPNSFGQVRINSHLDTGDGVYILFPGIKKPHPAVSRVGSS